MRRLGAALVLLVSGCASPAMAPFPTLAEPWFAFGAPVAPSPSPDGFGSEPGLLATRDGSLYVVSVLGSADARGDALWRSSDMGATWSYLGKPDYPFGGGDADLDEDEAGTLYLPGQWRAAAAPGELPSLAQPYVAQESMATSQDGGRTWAVNPIASGFTYTDRQWTATHGSGTAYLVFNQRPAGLVLTKSVDSGRTWASHRVVDGTRGPNGTPGDPIVDPRTGALYIPYGPSIDGAFKQHRLFVSRDGGVTFQTHLIHSDGAEVPGAIFGSLAMDTAGGLHYAWAEGTRAAGTRVYLRSSADGGATWSAPLAVSGAGVVAVFPWVAAGAPGHVAVAYYAAAGAFASGSAPERTEWFPVVALSRDLASENGTFAYATLSPTPNHLGLICIGGTDCTGGRTLGDFFEIGLAPDGRVVAAWADDASGTRTNRVAVQLKGSLL